MRTRLIISFDTEDFVDPVSNDVLLRIARILSERGVCGCFGLVGQKARFIRDEGRYDVVEALSQHNICYHSDNHFLFPDPLLEPEFASEFVEQKSWDEGVRRLVAEETGGLHDIAELFGRRPTTYLRTGGNSAAQMLHAYHLLGMKTFAYGPSIYEGARNILWFVNMSCISLPRVSEKDTYSGEAPRVLDELITDGVDLINVRFHPCKFMAETFWDTINFLGKWDVSRFGPWEPAPRLPEEETALRLKRLGEFIDYAKAEHDVEFTTYDAVTEELSSWPLWLDRETVAELARGVLNRLSYIQVAGGIFSLAEAFAAIIWSVLHPDAQRVPFRRVIGPVALPGGQDMTEAFKPSGDALLDACRKAEDELSAFRRVPAEALINGTAVPPAALLRAAAQSLMNSTDIRIEPAPLYPEGFDKTLATWDRLKHELIGFFPERGRNTVNMKQAVKLQYWSYKPTIPE